MENNNLCTTCNQDIDIAGFGKGRITSDGKDYFRYCRNCTSGGNTSVPDVWYGYGSGIQTEENIADPQTGKPLPFYDKTSKAAAMKQARVVEKGDRVHGARNEEHLNLGKKYI